MTVTTTAIVATDVVIKLDNAAGALVDISGASNRVEIQFQNGVAEFRAFSSQWKQRKVVGKDAPVTLDFVYSGNDAEARGLFTGWFFDGDDSARTLTIQAPDGSAGSDEFSGEFVLASWSAPFDSEADDFVRCSAELMPTGTVTHTQITS